eukprot:TRINITY_DN32055_c0_g2_i1.p1 TRINITY_DN32055_c0_g2~~TRINITY_DN32055_c0_g2_i1.p1  ORF type:complete len:437 (+),score=86.55 TRINITY_DN32055_c0_g2_i1:138-1448(+)
MQMTAAAAAEPGGLRSRGAAAALVLLILLAMIGHTALRRPRRGLEPKAPVASRGSATPVVDQPAAPVAPAASLAPNCSALLERDGDALRDALPLLVPNSTRPPPAVMLIGANNGNPRDPYWLPWAAGLRKVLVEPVPPNFRELKRVVAQAGLREAKLINAAVGSVPNSPPIAMHCPTMAAAPPGALRSVDREQIVGQLCSLNRSRIAHAFELNRGMRGGLIAPLDYARLIIAAAFKLQLPASGRYARQKRRRTGAGGRQLLRAGHGPQLVRRSASQRPVAPTFWTRAQRERVVAVLEAKDAAEMGWLLSHEPRRAVNVTPYAAIENYALLTRVARRFVANATMTLAYNVSLLTPGEILAKAGVPLEEVGFVQVDTEGHDAVVVRAMPWAAPSFRPRVVTFECMGLTPGERDSTLALLSSHGYEVCADVWTGVALLR